MIDKKLLDEGFMSRPQSLEQLLEEITPSVYESLKTAVEIGKWDDGNKLSTEQLENCMQAIILYESENLAEQDRTGALLVGCKSKDSNQI